LNVPGLHVQAVRVVLPLGVTEFTGQLASKHISSPETLLYLPAGHAVQTPPMRSYPALQKQSAGDVEPIYEMELTGQLEQADAPVIDEYFPASQAVQVPAPVIPAYLPIEQATQPSVPGHLLAQAQGHEVHPPSPTH
jgi:hypothetical protein